MANQFQDNSYDGISVIIPVYNASKYLHRTIDSVLNQTYKDIELILVNDGSKDDSLSVCRYYENKDERVVVIDKENGGVSSARNVGIDKATKKYISFMDNDDYMIPTYLETMYKYISMDGGRDLLVANAFHIWQKDFSMTMELLKCDNSDNLEVVDARNENELISKFKDIRTGLFATVWNALFVRDMIIGHSVRFKKTQSEDGLFMLEYLQHITSIRANMNYRGYAFIMRDDSQHTCNSYRCDMGRLRDNIVLQRQLQKRFHITDKTYITNIEKEYIPEIKSLLLKYHFKDTFRPWHIRRKTYKEISNFIKTYLANLSELTYSTSDKFLLRILRLRTYIVLDMFLSLYVKLKNK